MRKRKYSKETILKVRKKYINGSSQRQIAKKLKIPQQTIYLFVKDIPLNKRKKLPHNYYPKIIIPKSAKKLSKEKVRIISYLSGDGNVGKGLHNQTRIYYGSKIKKVRKKELRYRVEFYNKNINVINRFISDFHKTYGIKLKYHKKNMEVRTSALEIYKDLIKYTKYGCREWKIPFEILSNKAFKKEWLRVFCDCEAHIDNYKYTKKVIISSVNKKGLEEIKDKILKEFNINSYINGPYNGCFRLKISRKENIAKFKEEIGFYHPDKIKKLNQITKDNSNL